MVRKVRASLYRWREAARAVRAERGRQNLSEREHGQEGRRRDECQPHVAHPHHRRYWHGCAANRARTDIPEARRVVGPQRERLGDHS